MPIYCSVPFCKSNSAVEKALSFHEFPADVELRNQWIKEISRKDFVPNDNSSSSKVCGKHFKESDFVQHRTRKSLKKGSIPTIFPKYPSYMQVVNKTDRRIVKRKQDTNSFHPHKKLKTVITPTTDEANLLLNFATSFTDGEPETVNNYKNSENKFVQTKIRCSTIAYQETEIKRLRRLLASRNKEINTLNSKLQNMTKKLDYYEKNVYFSNVEQLQVLSDEGMGNIKVEFLLNQLKNFQKQAPRWPDNILRECVLLHATSPKGYKAIQDRNIFQLPSVRTLQRYVGPVCGQVGFTDLVKSRLVEEASHLKPEEKFASLIIDEMAIKPQCIYDSKLDRFFGSKSQNEDSSNDLYVAANRLLCFVLYGLSTKFCIPCAYFFTKQLTGSELHSFTQQVIQDVEKCGFFVVRIVTDNYTTNVSMFKNFAEGHLKPSIPHPCDPERQLFFSFDQNHIIKNMRSLYLERDMTDGNEIISGKFVKQLYRIQQDEKIKAVRNLTIKHVLPSNLEKMNVGRAVLIFSPPVVAALQFLQENSSRHPKAQAFKTAGATIKFLKYIYEWFCIHDVSNRKEYINTRNNSKMHFFSTDDERLQWLETEFLPYLSSIKLSCSQHVPPLKFLSKETHEAIELTTRSTIECTKYLLENGYHYVLTRSFNSDAVESLFSNLRGMNGGNDMMDVRSTIFSLEKILKTGIIKASIFTNAGNFLCQSSHSFHFNEAKHAPQRKDAELSADIKDILLKLREIPEVPRATLKTGSLAYVAGYILRTLELEIDCNDCIDPFRIAECSSPLLSLIKNQDRGGLFYPSPQFISILSIIQNFVEAAVKILPITNVSKNLKSHILPEMAHLPILICNKENHQDKICHHICNKFLSLLLKNIAKSVVFRVNTLNKPLSRKTLKLS